MASTISAGTTSGTAIAIAGDTSGALALLTNNGTTAVTIDTAQNVGIGTASANKLGLSKAVTTNSSSGYVGYELSVGDVSTADFITTASNAFVSTRTSIPLIFQTNATERMRIDSSGNVLVGVTSGMSGGGNDAKTGTQIFGGAGGFITNQNSSVTNIYLAKVSGYSSSNFMQFYVNGTLAGSITTTGTTVAFNTSSDYRLKENIAPMTRALSTVSQLKPVTYRWKLDGSNGQGFIAHELAEVCPDAVHGQKDATETYTDKDGNEQTRISPQGIDTSFLVATLTAAIQEQQALITDLTTRLVALENT